MLVVNDDISIPLSEFDFTFSRSGGPGGQNVNKVNTKVTLHWKVTDSEALPSEVADRFCQRHYRRINKEGELVLTSQRFRDRGRNVADCLAKLRELIVEVLEPPKPRKKTRTPRASKERRIREKKAKAQKKQLRKPPPRE